MLRADDDDKRVRACVCTNLFVVRSVAARRAHLDEDGERRGGLLARGGGGWGQAALHGGAHVVEAIAPRHPKLAARAHTLVRSLSSGDERVGTTTTKGAPRACSSIKHP